MCAKEGILLYRVQLKKGKVWVFVCPKCCLQAKKTPEYRYGGTWKGSF